MIATQITFHNEVDFSIQAQIFTEYTLISTGLAESGKSCFLSNDVEAYDIYFRDAATGRMLARQLGSHALNITLRKERGLYVLDMS